MEKIPDNLKCLLFHHKGLIKTLKEISHQQLIIFNNSPEITQV